MKTMVDLENELGITSETPLNELLEIFENNTIVTQAEINNIKAISVLPLPNNVKDRAEELKQRFTNIVLDENKGIIHLLNVRTALMSHIINQISELSNPYDRNALAVIVREIMEETIPDASEEVI